MPCPVGSIGSANIIANIHRLHNGKVQVIREKFLFFFFVINSQISSSKSFIQNSFFVFAYKNFHVRSLYPSKFEKQWKNVFKNLKIWRSSRRFSSIIAKSSSRWRYNNSERYLLFLSFCTYAGIALNFSRIRYRISTATMRGQAEGMRENREIERRRRETKKPSVAEVVVSRFVSAARLNIHGSSPQRDAAFLKEAGEMRTQKGLV